MTTEKTSSNHYQEQAMRTNDGKAHERLMNKLMLEHIDFALANIKVADLMNGLLGLAGETGEFSDMIKKWIFHEKVLDEEHAKKELGDICWYIALICYSMGWDLSEIMEMNVDKLKQRYPDGFDIEHSEHRQEGDV